MKLALFPSFFEKPKKIGFEHQEEDEIIELMLRQHFATQISWILIAIAAILLPVFLPLVITNYAANFLRLVPTQIVIGIILLWNMLILAFILEKFLFWYFNVYIVTNLHLVDINFHNLLNRDVTEVRLKDIESASWKMKGILGSVFDFGDVVVETAAKQQSIQFIAVPNPDYVADKINDLRPHDMGEQ